MRKCCFCEREIRNGDKAHVILTGVLESDLLSEKMYYEPGKMACAKCVELITNKTCEGIIR